LNSSASPVDLATAYANQHWASLHRSDTMTVWL
jgi:hypothetical protein